MGIMDNFSSSIVETKLDEIKNSNVKSHTHNVSDINELQTKLNSIPSLPISIANGGTGATTATQARTNLGIDSAISTALSSSSSLKITYGQYSGFTYDYNGKSKTLSCDGYPVAIIISNAERNAMNQETVSADPEGYHDSFQYTIVGVRGGTWRYDRSSISWSNNSVTISGSYDGMGTSSEFEFVYIILST